MLGYENDINQGRPKAKGVPQSDQWDDDMRMPKIPRKWQEAIYHKTQVMIGDNGPGVYRQIQDEIFLSKQCQKENGISKYPNPHDGRMEGEKFCFHFPASWYFSHAVNKAIGLRSCQLLPRWYNFRLHFRITLPSTTVKNVYITMQVIPSMNLAEVMSTISRKMDEQINLPTIIVPYLAYNAATYTARIEFLPLVGDHTQYTAELVNSGFGAENEFFDMMNVPQAKRASYFGVHADRIWEFPMVWDRQPQHLFFHASFVNHTQFNYLAQAGDFYPKPSKIYAADNLPSECYFWVSVDCMTPINLQFEHFMIELAFIIDSQDYQSP
jgi:hypothetical protein